MLRDQLYNDSFTLLILLGLVLIVMVKQLFSLRFSDYLEVVWNVRYLKLYSRERKRVDLFNSLLFINFLIALSIFLSVASRHTFTLQDFTDFIELKIAVGIGLFLILKSLLERLVGFAFHISEIISLYIFQKLTYINYSGLILLIVTGFLIFSGFNKTSLLLLGIGSFVIINAIGFIRFIRLYQNVIITHLFYFLLYLCALEFGPYIILYKVVKDFFV